MGSPSRDGDPKVPLSVCVMACDDEDLIGRCLRATAFAAEIIVVVDPRSSDGTEKIARELATRVEVHAYLGDVEQKRYVSSLARYPWVLSVDSDEVLNDELGNAVRALFADGEPPGSAYEVNRIVHHLGRWHRHGDWHPDWKLRLFRKDHAHFAGVNPHGRIVVDGPSVRLPGLLYHHSFRDLTDQIDRIQSHAEVAAHALHEQGRRASLTDLILRPPARFARAYLLKAGFRDGAPGLVVAMLIADGVVLKYAKLWELQRTETDGS